jgi:hypothetical protein
MADGGIPVLLCWKHPRPMKGGATERWFPFGCSMLGQVCELDMRVLASAGNPCCIRC